MLCNTATFRDDQINLLKPVIHRQCEGDASETAILKSMEAVVSLSVCSFFFFARKINRQFQ